MSRIFNFNRKSLVLYIINNVFMFCTIVFFSLSSVNAQNILINSGFENSPAVGIGNNINVSIQPWTLTGGRTTNVVRVDGPGGILYGTLENESGPQSDATFAGPGVRRNYFDVAAASANIYQSFTVPACENGAKYSAESYTISGHFSTRILLTGNGSISIREGDGPSGALVAGSSLNVNLPAQGPNKTWTPLSASIQLEAGKTYSYVAFVADGLNFDEASVIPVNPGCAAVALSKSSSSTPREVGDTLIYSFKAENVSIPETITIRNFALSDPKCASAITLQSATVANDDILESNESQLYSCISVPVTQEEYDAGSVLNTVNGNGFASGGFLGQTLASITTPLSRIVDLSISKSNGISSIFSGTNVNYTVVVTNNSPSAVTGAIVTDIVGEGLNCPSENIVKITGSGVPFGSYKISDLTSVGITLSTLRSKESATLSYSCQVN